MKSGERPALHTGAVSGGAIQSCPTLAEERAGQGAREEQRHRQRDRDRQCLQEPAPHGTGPGGSARAGAICNQGEYPWMHSMLL